MSEMKKINVGDEVFSDYILNNRYYLDKTLFIKEIFYEDASKVLLMTRPRRFGKTLAMSTFHEFLRINPGNPGKPEDTSYQERLFKDTKIYEDKEFCRDFMGKFPVIAITLKKVIGDTYKLAYKQLKDVIRKEIEDKCEYLLSSNKLNDLNKVELLKLRDPKYYSDGSYKSDLNSNKYDSKDDEDEIQNSLQNSLLFLTECLFKHHGVNPILLIDEYDVPLSKAAHFGYYDKMVLLIRGLLSNALKTNPYLGKAVLTGCLRAAKESIFTGLNNLDISSILDMGTPEISKGIGFTKEETLQVLRYYSLHDYCDMVTAHYDGYFFGREHMYCPWNVMNFCRKNYLNVGKRESDITAGNYWINSSGNDVIEEYMGYIRPEHIDQMQTLIDGGSITSVVRPTLCYGELKDHNIEDFWTLLLYTGYLTFIPDSVRLNATTNGNYVCELLIPNEEIKSCFRDRILSFFKGNPAMQNYTAEMVKGLFEGDAQKVGQNLNGLLKKYVSVRDTSTSSPKENFYQGLMIGALANASVEVDELHSNMESGDGYSDIKLSAIDGTKVVIELKQNDKKHDSRTLSAERAIKQIIEKRYAESDIQNPDISTIFAFGICFCKKECSVVTKQLK